MDFINEFNQRNEHLVLICVLVIGFSLIQLSSYSYAETGSKIMNIPISFHMLEFVSLRREFNKTDSINLELPESTWNLTDININFTNIHQVNSTTEYSGGGTMYGFVQKSQGIYALANEIRLDNPMTIDSIELYCYASDDDSDQIYLQIQGYDPNTNLPNSTIYGSPILLNVFESPQWYLQTFNEPINLAAGKYYLVINGSQLLESSTTYYWKYGDSSVLKSAYYTVNWSVTAVHCHFCYKLNQKSKMYKPSDINMEVEIEGIKYTILDGMTYSSGIFTIRDLKMQINDTNYPINIYTNNSAKIYFNYYYYISLNRPFISNGTLTIRENSQNSWNIFPTIPRRGYNQTIKIEFHHSWNDITVYKNNIDITSELIFNQNYCYIMNDTITDDTEWLITARSYLYDYEVDCSEDIIIQGNVLSISLLNPERNGIAILKIFNSQGIEIYNETKYLTSNSTIFNYTIPSDLPSGIYYAYIFWQNNVDAGVQSHAFFISDSNPGNKDNFNFLIMIILISSLSLALGFVSSYLVVESRKNKELKEQRKGELESEKLYERIIRNKFTDVFNLKSIIISEKLSGLYIFEKPFQDTKFDPLLVAGFVEAIKAFGNTIINIDTTNQILNIEYENSNIYMVEVNTFNFILIMAKKPSNEFLLTIDNLVEEIDYRYGDKIENFRGDICAFDGIMDLIEKSIDVNLLDPYRFNLDMKYEFTREEKNLLQKAYRIMEENSHDYFYLSSLLSKSDFEIQTAENILKLIKKSIFIPIENI